jgi:hypothetical protein
VVLPMECLISFLWFCLHTVFLFEHYYVLLNRLCFNTFTILAPSRDLLDKDKVIDRYKKAIQSPPHFIINLKKDQPLKDEENQVCICLLCSFL